MPLDATLLLLYMLLLLMVRSKSFNRMVTLATIHLETPRIPGEILGIHSGNSSRLGILLITPFMQDKVLGINQLILAVPPMEIMSDCNNAMLLVQHCMFPRFVNNQGQHQHCAIYNVFPLSGVSANAV